MVEAEEAMQAEVDELNRREEEEEERAVLAEQADSPTEVDMTENKVSELQEAVEVETAEFNRGEEEARATLAQQADTAQSHALIPAPGMSNDYANFTFADNGWEYQD